MADSLLGKVKKAFASPPPPPYILERLQHRVVIPWYVRLWEAIRPPAAPGASRMSSTQRRLVLFTIAAIVLCGAGYGFYSWMAGASDRSRVVYAEGMSRLGPGDFKAAILKFDDAIRIWPENADAYLQRAIAHSALDESDAALNDWTKALQLHPDSALAYNSRGTHYRLHHDTTNALQDLNRSIELAPSVDAYYQRGQVYSELGDHQKAIADFDRAIDEKRESPFVYWARAQEKRAIGDEEGFAEDQATAKFLEHH